jgi:energy-coupling factor transporter ATP-binding protein EcfA2
MALNVVLIIGASNSGKSTLVRLLSGIGKGVHRHPSAKNISLLNWGSPLCLERTLCLISSLNEGSTYSPKDTHRDLSSNSYNSVAPWDLVRLLDLYDQNDEYRCSRAILCISTTVKTRYWTADDYATTVNNGSVVNHAISQCIFLGPKPETVVNCSKHIQLDAAPHPRNDVAAAVRLAVQLQ